MNQQLYFSWVYERYLLLAKGLSCSSCYSTLAVQNCSLRKSKHGQLVKAVKYASVHMQPFLSYPRDASFKQALLPALVHLFQANQPHSIHKCKLCQKNPERLRISCQLIPEWFEVTGLSLRKIEVWVNVDYLSFQFPEQRIYLNPKNRLLHYQCSLKNDRTHKLLIKVSLTSETQLESASFSFWFRILQFQVNHISSIPLSISSFHL